MTEPFPRRLPIADKVRLVAEIVGTYVRARRRMRHADIRDVVGELRTWAQRRGGRPAPTMNDALRLGRAVHKTLGPLPFDSRCLVQSLVLTSLLARRGVTGTLVIGVRPGDDFAAHAWVELDGIALLAPGFEFARLAEL